MQEINVIIIALTGLKVYSEALAYLLDPDTKPNYPRFNRFILKYPKPLACSKCMGFWVSILLSIILLNPLMLVIFLLNLMINKQ